jgi:hypothetical protein
MSEPEKEEDWMIAKVDQRIALMKEAGAFDIASGEQPLIFSFLDEGDHEMTSAELARWERTCDRCGKYVPDIGTETFYTGHIVRTIEGRQVILAFGICGTCKNNPKGTQDV